MIAERGWIIGVLKSTTEMRKKGKSINLMVEINFKYPEVKTKDISIERST